MKNKGKLIVLDGSDGSGKATQTKKLIEYAKSKNITSTAFSYPRYDSFYGKIIKRFQSSEFGDPAIFNPYIASLPYAFDRLSSKDELEQALSSHEIVILDRYVSSNIAHQGGKITDINKRIDYIKWLEEMEYSVNQIPRENLVIFLHVPYQISMDLLKKMDKDKDALEENSQYLNNAEQAYLWCSQHFNHWVKISCVDHNDLLSIEEISTKIIKTLDEKDFFKREVTNSI